MNQRHIHRKNIAPEQSRYFAEKNRDVIRLAGLHGFADIAADEHGIGMKTIAVLGIGIGCFALRMNGNDLHVAQLAGALHHRLNQLLRCGSHAVYKNPVTRPDH